MRLRSVYIEHRERSLINRQSDLANNSSADAQNEKDKIIKQLKEIENSAGRNRHAPKFSARTLDIDIILQINDTDEIIFESEEIHKYQFVSEPLQELI